MIAAAAAIAWPSAARCQACCSGATALTPARLAPHEDALIGAQIRASAIYGSFDPGGHFIAAPPKTVELELEQDLVIAARPFRRAQISIFAPIIETYRGLETTSEIGGGLGDIAHGFRYDFSLADRSTRHPGIAALGSLTLPTGTPPEGASNALLTDATGKGSVQAGAGLAVEEELDHAVFNLTGSVTWRGPRAVGSHRIQDGLEILAFGAGGYVFKDGSAIVLTLSYTVDLPAKRDGVVEEIGGRAHTRVGLSAGYPVGDTLRLQGGLFADLPIAHTGFADPLLLGLSLAALFPWI